MKRRTLDILFSVVGLGLAVLLLIIGIVLTNNANFAKDYVHNQLDEQKVFFPKGSALTSEERKASCVVDNAGKQLLTGKQAECYANQFIALHLRSIPNSAGKTYAQLGDVQTALRAQITAAQATGSPIVASLQQQLTNVTAARETVFKGETLRGLLLTSYGFSVFGDKGDQVATVCYIVAGLLLVLSVAGFVHAFTTPKDRAFAPPEHLS